MVLAHLIFRADISPGADCASKQQRSCKWEWVKELVGGWVGGDSGSRGGKWEVCVCVCLLRNHKHRFIYSP